MAFLVDNIVPITLRIEDVIVFSSPSTLAVARNFTTLDPVLQTHMTMQTPKTFAGDFEINVEATFNPTQTNRQTMVAGSSIGSNEILLDKSLNQIRLIAFNGDTLLPVVTADITADSKLHKIRVRYSGSTAYLSVDSGVESSALWNLTGVQDLVLIGARPNGTNYFDGVIANVTLTDLSNPSNSESWKLDRPIGTNTEQSSSGNNLLTYVNATKRELFTKVGNDWLGVESPPTPINFLSWLVAAGAGSITANSYTSINSAGQGVFFNTGKTGRHRLTYNITAGDVNWQIKDSATGQGVDPNILTASSPSQSGVMDYTSVNGGIYIRHDVSSGVTVTVNNFKNQRLLEVA